MLNTKFDKLTYILLFQGDSGGPLQVMKKDGRYVIIGMNALISNLSIE
jgi:hypothetical protein